MLHLSNEVSHSGKFSNENVSREAASHRIAERLKKELNFIAELDVFFMKYLKNS